MTRASQTRPLGTWTSTFYRLTRGDERGLLQIDDDTGLVVGCAPMPSVIGLTLAQATSRLRGWKVSKE